MSYAQLGTTSPGTRRIGTRLIGPGHIDFVDGMLQDWMGHEYLSWFFSPYRTGISCVFASGMCLSERHTTVFYMTVDSDTSVLLADWGFQFCPVCSAVASCGRVIVWSCGRDVGRYALI